MQINVILAVDKYVNSMNAVANCGYIRSLKNSSWSAFESEIVLRHDYYWNTLLDDNFTLKFTKHKEDNIYEIAIFSKRTKHRFAGVIFIKPQLP